MIAAWKVSEDGVFSGAYFPAFELNTERYRVLVRMRENADQKIHRIWTLLTQWIIELLNQNSVRTASEVRGFINGKGKIGDFNNTKWGQYKYYLMKKRKWTK